MDASAGAKSLALWFLILGSAILNGALRESILIPRFGAFAGLIASGVILSSWVFLVALLGVPWYGRRTSSQWWLQGLFWLLLTVTFEFSFGRYVQHNTWRELVEAYTFKGGNIWPLVLVSTFISPWLAARVRGRI